MSDQAQEVIVVPTRQDARAKLLGKERGVTREPITFEGDSYDIVQLTVGKRREMIDSVRNPETGEPEALALQVMIVIWCTFVPGTSERIFDNADLATLNEQPCGGFVDQFSEVAMRINNIG